MRAWAGPFGPDDSAAMASRLLASGIALHTSDPEVLRGQLTRQRLRIGSSDTFWETSDTLTALGVPFEVEVVAPAPPRPALGVPSAPPAPRSERPPGPRPPPPSTRSFLVLGVAVLVFIGFFVARARFEPEPSPRATSAGPVLDYVSPSVFEVGRDARNVEGLAFAVGDPPVLVTVPSAVPGKRPGDYALISGASVPVLAVAPEVGLVVLQCPSAWARPLPTASGLETEVGTAVYGLHLGNGTPLSVTRLGETLQTEDSLHFEISLPAGREGRGGPLLDAEGRVIGVITDTEHAEGRGLAVPIEMLKSDTQPVLRALTDLSDIADPATLRRVWRGAKPRKKVDEPPVGEARGATPTKLEAPYWPKRSLSVVDADYYGDAFYLKARLTVPTRAELRSEPWRLTAERGEPLKLVGFELMMTQQNQSDRTTTYTLQYFGKSRQFVSSSWWTLRRGQLESEAFLFKRPSDAVRDILRERTKAPPRRRPFARGYPSWYY